AGFPKVTDVYLAPELFSPNFDGLIDTTTIHYRALEPVNVDVTVEDSGGNLVALLEQAAPTPGDYQIEWDGRGLDGRVVDDGVFVVRLDGHEMQVEVDTTPVGVNIVYEEPYRIEDGPFGPEPRLYPTLTYVVSTTRPEEVEIVEEIVERGLGEIPATWQPFPRLGQEDRSDDLTLEEYTGATFRVRVRDNAENLTVESSSYTVEKLMFRDFGEHGPDATGVYPSLGVHGEILALIERQGGEVALSVSHTSRSGVVRFRLAESIVAPIADVFVEYSTGVSGPWTRVPVSRLVEPGTDTPLAVPRQHLFEAVWDTTGETAGFSRFVRLVAVDTDGTEHFSSGATLVKEPAVECQELDFLGPLELGALAIQEATPCNDWPAIFDRVLMMLDATGVDPGVMPVLWAVETVPGELSAPDLIVRSPAPDRDDLDA
ncbi:MAG: FlgD immunoglobulin-like domain containing protein, partial [Acidobacteriota bacterium]